MNEAYPPLPQKLEDLATEVVDSALEIHKKLGPGLLEKVYEVCLCHELSKRGIETKRQVPVVIRYDNIVFDEGLRLDVLVKDSIILELKVAEKHNPGLRGPSLNLHEAYEQTPGFRDQFQRAHYKRRDISKDSVTPFFYFVS